MEEKNAMQALFDRAAPLAKRFLEDPALMERLKKAPPGSARKNCGKT